LGLQVEETFCFKNRALKSSALIHFGEFIHFNQKENKFLKVIQIHCHQLYCQPILNMIIFDSLSALKFCSMALFAI